jgi:tripartite ATP-independent transporter DctM subunit
MTCFCLYIGIVARKSDNNRSERRYSVAEKIKSLIKILPVLILISFVLGSIYAGWATPTEAAAIGVLGAVLLGIMTRCLNLKLLIECLVGAVRTNCMVMLILIGASFFSVTLGFLGLPKWISASIVSFGAGKYTVIALIIVVYLILGCLIDGYSMIVMTVPMFLPLVQAYGMDSLWYGIFVVLLVQIANITPPIGFNLFLVTGLAEKSIGFVSRSVLPFITIMIVFIALMTIFPQVVMFMPNMMGR